jgi:lipopolysaccharide export system protein LptA
MRWQRRIRIGIILFAAAFLVAVYLAVRPAKSRGTTQVALAPVQDPAASAQSTGGHLLNLLRDVENFRLEYDRLLTYPDGRQKVTGARVLVPHRGGRDFRITAREAEVGPAQDLITMQGAVELTSSDGLVARTGAATFSQAEGILRAPGEASFEKRGMSGSSLGVTYDKGRDVLSMLDRAVMKLRPQRPGDETIDIAAGAAFYARADHYVRYERGFTMRAGTRTLASRLATAYLTEDGSRVQTLEMRGQSRIAGVGQGAGAIRSMESDDINLEFSGDGRTLAGATLSSTRPGHASIELGSDAASSRRVVGQWIDIRFAPDGATVSGLTVREAVGLTLPAEKEEPGRTITASTLTAKGDAGASLNAAHFADRVEYRESAPAGSTPRTVRAQELDLTTAPGLGAIEAARFTGAVRFEDSQFRGSSGRARYLVGEGRIELEGVDQSTGQVPRVTDGQVAINASHIEITMDSRRIAARQDVRSAMTPVSKDSPSAAGRSVRRAGMLQQDQPAYATAAGLDYDGTAHVAVYTSQPPAQARLWQGDTTVQGDRLTVDDATGNLAASGHVTSTLVLDQRDEKTQKVDHTTSIGSGDEFLYEDGPRRATYSGKAHVSGPQGDLRAKKIDLYLSAAGHELDRVEADADVSLLDGARKARGDHLTYVAAEGRYVVVGSPVRIEADCRETTGRTLTFYKSTNNIVVEPGEEFRTQVKSIPKCEPGRD